MESSSFIITNIYAPNIPRKRKKLFQKLETYIKNNNNNIPGGDFNMVEIYKKTEQTEIRRHNIMVWNAQKTLKKTTI